MPSYDWCAPIDAYCERTDAGFWSEPVNAVSNGAFLIAAGLAFALWRRSGGRDRAALALIVVTAIVGIGSFLFHTFANRWSLLADVIPIAFFIYGYFALAMARFFGRSIVVAVLLTIGFAAFSKLFTAGWQAVIGRSGVDWTNGSIGYFPAALAMLAVGGLLLWQASAAPADDPSARRERAGWSLLVAAAIFAFSLLFRSIDLAVCSWFAVGTHFLWHVLNAAVLYVLVRGAILFNAARGAG